MFLLAQGVGQGRANFNDFHLPMIVANPPKSAPQGYKKAMEKWVHMSFHVYVSVYAALEGHGRWVGSCCNWHMTLVQVEVSQESNT